MNEIEAKSKIKHRIGVIREIAGSDSKSVEDLEIAVQVLKEIREYRELGTVEELKSLRNASELWEHNNNLAYEQGRIDAVDEFAEKIELEISESIIWDMLATMSKNGGLSDTSDKIVDYVIETSNEIAEQMKGGATDERTGSN